jgi:pyruvate dehydrogenase E2 component (dihydrolipoamide acetyltransferase)
MAREIRLPQLGQTMEEGTIINCLVKVGEQVSKGDVIFEIETDKATLEMESPSDGFVKHILVEIDQTLTVGSVVMILGDEDEEVPESFIDQVQGKDSSAPTQSPAQAQTVATEQPQAKESVKQASGKVMVSPRAKKLAQELGVDINKVTGSGPAGKITEQDIKTAANMEGSTVTVEAMEIPADQVQLGQTIKLNKQQKFIAERMLKSKHEIPCYYLTIRADVTELVKLRTKINENADTRVTYNDFIIKAVGISLKKYPIMTGQLEGETIKLASAINVGLAIALPDGLVAPILKDIDKKDVKQIADQSKALVEKAKINKLAPDDLEGGCITISNLGSYGIDSFIPIVVPGQCSILGIGQISDVCMPENGNIIVRKFMNMTLSVDHKIANGAYAAQFLDLVKKTLEDVSNFK